MAPLPPLFPTAYVKDAHQFSCLVMPVATTMKDLLYSALGRRTAIHTSVGALRVCHIRCGAYSHNLLCLVYSP